MRAVGLAAVAIALALAPASARAEAARPPVVMIQFDEFPTGDLMLPDGRLDRERFPGFARLAAASTWFRSASTVHDSTPYAAPAILDGRQPRRTLLSGWRSHPHSVFTLLDRMGYRIEAREEAVTVCPPRLCPRTDHYGNAGANAPVRRKERLQQRIDAIRATTPPTFTYVHALLPHVPWMYLPSGHKRRYFAPSSLPDFSTPDGFGSRFLTAHLQQSHLLQVGFVDHEIGRLIDHLKAERLWKRALVVVTADHGIAFQVGTTDRRRVTEANVSQIAPVPLFVKLPGEDRDGRVSDAYVQTTDVLPTIAHLLGTKVRNVNGHDAFGPVVRARTGISIERREFTGRIRVRGRDFEQMRRRDALQRAKQFGTGPWSRVYRIGPDRDLLGRPVAELPAAPPGPRARFVFPVAGDLARVRPTAVPTLAGGSIDGASPGDRDIALAVNGRVRASGRTVHLRGDPNEYFFLNVPESSLRATGNRVELFEIRRVGLVRTLSPLGSR